MSEASELQRLEIFVGKLLAEFKDLQKELVEKKAIIEDLNDQVAMHQLEREDIGDRVTRIVTQFESWERDLAEEELMGEMSSKSGQQDVATSVEGTQSNSLYSGE